MAVRRAELPPLSRSQPTNLGGLLEDGVGGGALAVPLLGMSGGYALSGRGPVWARMACAVFAMAPIPAWATTATMVGGDGLALDTPRGAWVAVLFYSFLAVLALASAIPHLPVVSSDRVGAVRPTTQTVQATGRQPTA